MPKKIIDQFTNLPVSAARKGQLRHQAAGLCLYCRRAPVSGSLCRLHLVANRERQRKRVGTVKPYLAPGQLRSEKKEEMAQKVA